MLNQRQIMNEIEEANTLYKGIEEWINQGPQKIKDAIRVGEILTNHRAKFPPRSGWMKYLKANFTAIPREKATDLMNLYKHRAIVGDSPSIDKALIKIEGLGQRSAKQELAQLTTENWTEAIRRSNGGFPTAKIVQEVLDDSKKPSTVEPVIEPDNSKQTLDIIAGQREQEEWNELEDIFKEAVEDPKRPGSFKKPVFNISHYNSEKIKEDFQEIWERCTEYTDLAYKRRFASDLVAWMFLMFPSLIDEFQLKCSK